MTATSRRPTPADPMPYAATRPGVSSGASRDLPPELGPDAIGVLEGRAFMFSDARGDVPRGSIGGLVHDDTRFLNQWELTLDDTPLLLLSSGTVDAYSAAFFLANSDLPRLPANRVGRATAALRRRRPLRTRRAAVFRSSSRCRSACAWRSGRISPTCSRSRSRVATVARTSSGSTNRTARHLGSGTATAATWRRYASRPTRRPTWWTATPGVGCASRAGQQWSCELQVPLRCGEEDYRPAVRGFGEAFDPGPHDPSTRWAAEKPHLHTDMDLLRDVYHKSAIDLVSMRIEKTIAGEPVVLLAAGPAVVPDHLRSRHGDHRLPDDELRL